MTNFKLRTEEEEEPTVNFWLQRNDSRVKLMGRKRGSDSSYIVVSIEPSGRLFRPPLIELPGISTDRQGRIRGRYD